MLIKYQTPIIMLCKQKEDLVARRVLIYAWFENKYLLRDTLLRHGLCIIFPMVLPNSFSFWSMTILDIRQKELKKITLNIISLNLLILIWKTIFKTIRATFDYCAALNLFINMENFDQCKDVDCCSCNGHILLLMVT